MTTATGKTRCVRCGKERATLRCGGCLEEFCSKHLGDHQQELNKQFDEIEVSRDLFRQSLTEQIEKPNNNMLIKQIDKWEHNSIKTIQQTAEEARQILFKNTNEYIHSVEIKLNELTNQLRQCRQEDDFNEINLRQFQEELKQLTKELSKPSNISIREDSTPFIKKLSVSVSGKRVIFYFSRGEQQIYNLKKTNK
jgi:DNA-binding PucR family transcriptional regulator